MVQETEKLKVKKKTSVSDSLDEKDTHTPHSAYAKPIGHEPTSINEIGFDKQPGNEENNSIGKGDKVAEKVEGVEVKSISNSSSNTDEEPLSNKLDPPSREDFVIYLNTAEDTDSIKVQSVVSNNRPKKDHYPHKPLEPEDYIRQLENELNDRLSEKRRDVMKHIAAIYLGKGIGGTRRDLEKIDIAKDNAEKMLRELREDGFLIRNGKTGRMNRYVPSNLVHLMSSSAAEVRKTVNHLPFSVSLVLAAELAKTHYGYHNIGLQTSLNYKEDYDILDWPIKSQKNKQKVKRFMLDKTRTCTFTVSPTTNVEIDIQCTHKEYFFHTSGGMLDLFESGGEIKGILKREAQHRMEVVSPIGEWLLTHFDYSKNPSIRHLQDNYPIEKMSWEGKGVLKLRYLATFFQIYQKPMPFVGDCLRIDGHKRIKGGVKMTDMLERINRAENDKTQKHPFVTLEEMLLSGETEEIEKY